MIAPLAGRLAPDRRVALVAARGGAVTMASPLARALVGRDPVGAPLAEVEPLLGCGARRFELPPGGGPDTVVAVPTAPADRAPPEVALAIARLAPDGWEPAWASPVLASLLGASGAHAAEAERLWEAAVVLADRPVLEAAWRERLVAGRGACRYRVAGLDGRVRTVEDHAWLIEPVGASPLVLQVLYEARSEEGRAAPTDDGGARMARVLGDLVLVLEVDREGIRRIEVADGDPRALLALPASPRGVSPAVLGAALDADGRAALDAHAARLLATGSDDVVVRLRGVDDGVRTVWLASHAVRRGAGTARVVTTASRIDGILAALERGDEGPLDVSALTPRQREALVLLAQGLSNQEIADLLDVAPGTVGKLLGAVFARLGVRGRAEAVQVARRLVAG